MNYPQPPPYEPPAYPAAAPSYPIPPQVGRDTSDGPATDGSSLDGSPFDAAGAGARRPAPVDYPAPGQHQAHAEEPGPADHAAPSYPGDDPSTDPSVPPADYLNPAPVAEPPAPSGFAGTGEYSPATQYPAGPAIPSAADAGPADLTNQLGQLDSSAPAAQAAPAAEQRNGLAAPPPAPAPVMDPPPQHATDWTYTPRRSSTANRPTAAEWGWRARIGELSGGLITLPPGPVELQHRTAIARIRSTLPGSRTLVVANEKGGAGKTPTALILSALLAEYRREAVVAWDVNELRGTLGLRAQVTDPPLTVTDVLAAAPELARPEAEVGLLSAYLRRQPEGNLVLASSEDGNAMRQIGHAECDVIRQLLLRRYGMVVCDTGNNAAAPNFLYTVDSADVLILPTAPSDVHLKVARAMLRMLASRSTTSHLVSRAVLVVTSVTGARLEPEEERWFTDRIGRVVHVPADPVIAQGGKLTISELSQASIRAWTQVAGAVIEAALAPSPNDRVRGRRRAAEQNGTAPAGGLIAGLSRPPVTDAGPGGAGHRPQPAPSPFGQQNQQSQPLSADWIPVTPPE